MYPFDKPIKSLYFRSLLFLIVRAVSFQGHTKIALSSLLRPCFTCITIKLLVVYHLQQVSGKSSWKINGIRLSESFQRKISESNGISEKVVLFFRMEYCKRKFVFISSSKPSLIPVSGLRDRFSINVTDWYIWKTGF